ncbi:MAG: FecR domain-containing protein [Gammaproteobacteria bacterium]|nr:FecR domain-containing protein [Gammaproteobacteria bacterium]
MNKPMKTLAGAILFLLSPLGLAAPQPAGEVTLLTGRGTAVSPDGVVRDLAKGAPVYSGEMVNTGVNSYLNMQFTDGGLVLLRPNSRFQIQDYSYRSAPLTLPSAAPARKSGAASGAPAAASPAEGRALFRLLKGGFRTVTGLIGKGNPDDYRVSAGVATLGIRGTDYFVYLCDAACAADPVVAANAGAGAGAGGVLVGVIRGTVFTANEAGQQIDVGEDQHVLTLPDGTQVELPFAPRFVRVDPIPNPESCAR